MTDTVSRLCDELAVFADLGTDAPKAMRHGRHLVVNLVRGGEELRLDFLDDGAGKVIVRTPTGHRLHSHASYKALLASEAFGSLRVWADHQKTYLQETLKDVGTPIEVNGVLPSNVGHLGIKSLDDFLVSRNRNDLSVQVMLIDGPAGIGKTKFIEFLAKARAEKYLTVRRPLILHVQSRGRVLTFLQDLIAFSLQRLRLGVTFDQLPILVRHGLVTLAIDGFDELGDPNGYDLAWGQVNELVNQIRGQGTLILAGRETFIGRDRVAKSIKSLGDHDVLEALTLEPPEPNEAKAWLRTREWSEEDLASAYPLFERGSYALRPFFLMQLAGQKVVSIIRERAVGHALPFLVDVMVEREAGKFGDAIDSIMTAEQRQEFVRRFLREVARHMADDQTDAIDEVSMAWLVEFAVPRDTDVESLSLLRNRAAVVAFLEKDDAPRYRRFAHSQLFNYFLGEEMIDATLNGEMPKFVRRNILGADFLAAFSDLVLPLAATKSETVREFFRVASKRAREHLGHDRAARNLGALLVTMLPAMEGVADIRIDGIGADEAVIQGTVPRSVITGTMVNQLDIRAADLRAVEFEECWIGTLIVDETSRVPLSFPAPDRIRRKGVGPEGSVIVVPGEIASWLDRHGRVDLEGEQGGTSLIPVELRNHELTLLLERACRGRAYWIPKVRDDNDHVAKFVDDPLWAAVLELLKQHDLLREARLSSSGRKATFFHIKRSNDILKADPEDSQIRNFYRSLVARIRGNGH